MAKESKRPEKYEEKLHLDMSFNEAITRLAKVKKKEVDEKMNEDNPKEAGGKSKSGND